MVFKRAPGCKCCVPLGCLLGSDNFDDDLDKWTFGDTVGDWEIVGTDPHLQAPGANAFILFKRSHPDDIHSCIVQAIVRGNTGDKARLWCGGELFVELEIGVALRLIDATGIIAEVPTPNADAGEWHALTGCYHAGDEEVDEGFTGEIYNFWGDTLFTHRTTVDAGPTGDITHVGLATGDVATNVQFDNFKFYRHKSELHPECEVCDECLIYEDGFGDTGLDLNHWDVKSGAWLSGGSVVETGSANAYLACTDINPSGNAQNLVECWIRGSEAGDKAQVIVSTESSFKYIYVEFEFASITDNVGHIRLHAAGSDMYDFHVPGLTVDTWHYVRCGVSIGWIVGNAGVYCEFYADGGEPYIVSWPSIQSSMVGPSSGVGTGDTCDGTIEFDQFRLSRYYSSYSPECLELPPTPLCLPCDNAITPATMAVTWAGIINFYPPLDVCQDCGDLNGTYILDYVEYDSDNNNCYWVHELETPVCGFTHVILRMTNLSLSPVPRVVIADAAREQDATQLIMAGESTMGTSSWACSTWSNRQTGYVTNNANSTCWAPSAAATCHITSGDWP